MEGEQYPSLETMLHSDTLDPTSHQEPTDINSQLRELGLHEDRVPEVNGSRHGSQHGRTRPKSADSQRSGFSAIIEEDGISPPPRSPDRLVRVPSHVKWVLCSNGMAPTNLSSGRGDKHDLLYESSSSGRNSIREHSRKHSSTSSVETYETKATSTLPQHGKTVDEAEAIDSMPEDESTSYDLAAPIEDGQKLHTIETLSEILFSREHLKTIFADPSLLLKFTAFLSTYRPRSVPVLIYYLDAMKALKAINYANALAEALEPIAGYNFTSFPAKTTMNSVLEDKAEQAFSVLVQEDLPAYITHTYVQVVHSSVVGRITGATVPRSQDVADGLAEIFCLSDPSRPDNPIVFASEGMHSHARRLCGYNNS